MTRKLTALLATATMLGGFVAATSALAEDAAPASPPAQSTTGTSGDHGGMMPGDHGEMMRMGQTPPDRMSQMHTMAADCHRMMGGATGDAPMGPGMQRAPDHQGDR
jgi:hypothetical protein